MAISSKAWAITGTAVVVVGLGGYLGAQAVVGSEVEKSLVQAFQRLDASPGWRVTDVRIDRSLFETTAHATLGVIGYEDATAALDLNVDHGVFKSPVTGTIRPHEALFTGTIDIDMVASLSGAKGQLRAETLRNEEMQGELQGLVMDIDYADDTRWRVDTRIDTLGFTYVDGTRVRLESPRIDMEARGENGREVRQRIDLPHARIITQDMKAYLDEVTLEAETRPTQSRENTRLIDQTATLSVAEFGTDDTSMGSLSMVIAAQRWDMQAFQHYHEAFATLTALNYRREQDPASFDESRYRESLAQAVDNGYVFLSESPRVQIDPLKAHIVLPALNLDFEPHLSVEMRFDGEGLSREALYSVARHTDTPASRLIESENAPMSEAQTNAYFGERLHLEASMNTPPEEVLSQLPLMVRFMIDSSHERQTLAWEQGRLTLNGEALF